MEKEREEFEKWKKVRSMNVDITIRDSNGDYQYLETRRDWYVWWNAIATRQPEIDALNEKLESREAQMETVGSIERELRNELARLKAENDQLRKDAERWVFHMDNKNFRYFRNSGVWETLGQDGALIEGRATTYKDAVDAAIAAMKEMK